MYPGARFAAAVPPCVVHPGAHTTLHFRRGAAGVTAVPLLFGVRCRAHRLLCCSLLCEGSGRAAVLFACFSLRPADMLAPPTVVLSAIQDILLQIHLRECGLL